MLRLQNFSKPDKVGMTGLFPVREKISVATGGA